MNVSTTSSFSRHCWLEESSVQREWTDGCYLPYEGAASAGNDLILGFCHNERFPMISRQDMREYALARGHSIYALAKIVPIYGPGRKLFGTDLGWCEVPFEDDLKAAEGL